MSELVVEKPLEKFNEIFKTPKYRRRIAQMALSASTSLILDFEDLLIADIEFSQLKSLLRNKRIFFINEWLSKRKLLEVRKTSVVKLIAVLSSIVRKFNLFRIVISVMKLPIL